MRLDEPYRETDHINPHYGHIVQPLGEGAWCCVNCGEFHDWMMDNGFTSITWDDTGFDVS